MREETRRLQEEHQRHVREHEELMATFGSDTLDVLFKEVFGKHMKGMVKPYREWTVEDWLEWDDITKSEQKSYPNAKKAFQVRNSKLNKVLK